MLSPAHIWATLPNKKVSKCSWKEILNLDMCLVDLVEEILEFVALLYQHHRRTGTIRPGGGGVLFARKNYIVPECFIVEIRFLLPQNVRKKHSFTILNIF